MKTIQRGGIAIAVILIFVFAISFVLRAQSDNPLQPVALSDTPQGSGFFKLSEYLASGGTLGGPYPGDPATNAPLYLLRGKNYLVDDTSLTNDDDLVNALSLLVQPQDGFSKHMMSANSMDPVMAVAIRIPPEAGPTMHSIRRLSLAPMAFGLKCRPTAYRLRVNSPTCCTTQLKTNFTTSLPRQI